MARRLRGVLFEYLVDVTVGETPAPVPHQDRDEALAEFRRKQVVGVEKHQIRTSALLESSIASEREAAIALSNRHDARIGRNVTETLDRLIRRAVIHYDDLQIPQCLLQCAAHRLRQIVRLAITRDDDAD